MRRIVGAAIIAGSLLEDFIAETIKIHLVHEDKAIEKLFTGFGPLATFSAKIEMAYLMGILSKQSRTLARTVKDVWNDFAHNMDPLTFNTQMIKNKCQRLLYKKELKALYLGTKELFKRHGNMMGVVNSVFPKLISVRDS